jgi:K+-transporting ATPase KdpF subunit
MRGPAAGCERVAMTEPILALIVAAALGAYLVHTLVRPEKY